MKAVIQRVKSAEVRVDGAIVSQIQGGVLTLLGVEKGDTAATAEKMIQKICELRIFSDEQGKMNLSLLDTKGSHLVVSQFTLAADCNSGRRPSFGNAEAPARAKEIYEHALAFSKKLNVATLGGIFQADMEVSLTNDGPVTFILSSSTNG